MLDGLELASRASRTCLRHAPRSHHAARLFEVECEAGATCTAPKDAWTSKTHVSPRIRQDRRGTNAASSPFRQNGISRSSQRLIARGTGLAGRVRNYASKLEITATMPCSRAGWPKGPDMPRERRWIRRRIRGAAGRRERTVLMAVYEAVGLSSLYAGSAIRWLAPRPWETADAQTGRTGRRLFAAIARSDL
jgi:hypothetical protein